MSPGCIAVVIVDDHPLFRMGMAGLLGSLEGISVAGQAADAEQARAVVTDAVDVVLMDLDLAGDSGIDLTRELVRARPALAVLVVTMSDDAESVAKYLEAVAGKK